MGVFSKVSKTFKAIAKNPTNIRNYADAAAQSLTFGQLDTNGLNTSAFVGGKDVGAGMLGDALLGKKSKTINPDDIAGQIRATQSQGLNELNSALNNGSGGDIARQQNAQEQKGILTTAQDARRNAQRSMAQAGLKGTSLGLGLNRSIDQSAGRDLASVNAQLPGQIRNQAINDAQTRIGAGNVNQNGMNFNKIEGSRSGGLLGIAGALAPIAGTVAGAMYGGPAGAAAGGQAGQGLSQIFKPQQATNARNGSGNYGGYA